MNFVNQRHFVQPDLQPHDKFLYISEYLPLRVVFFIAHIQRDIQGRKINDCHHFYTQFYFHSVIESLKGLRRKIEIVFRTRSWWFSSFELYLFSNSEGTRMCQPPRGSL